MTTANRRYSLGPLYDLLDDKMAHKYTNKYGNLDIAAVAEILGITTKAVYQHIKANKLPAEYVRPLRAAIGEENISYEELAPFVFK